MKLRKNAAGERDVFPCRCTRISPRALKDITTVVETPDDTTYEPRNFPPLFHFKSCLRQMRVTILDTRKKVNESVKTSERKVPPLRRQKEAKRRAGARDAAGQLALINDPQNGVAALNL